MGGLMGHWYTEWIEKKTPLYAVAGLLLIASLVLLASAGDIQPAQDFIEMWMAGQFLIGLYFALLGVVAALGSYVDNERGKSITLALAATPGGAILLAMHDWALRIGWAPIWVGLVLGLMVIVGYAAWRVQVRITVVTLGGIIYAMVVSLGFLLTLTRQLSANVVIGVIGVGGLVLVMTAVPLIGYRERVRVARREGRTRHLRNAVIFSQRPLLLLSLLVVVASLAAVFLGAGPVRTFGAVFAIGAAISGVTTFMLPAPLSLVLPELATPVEPERGNRRESRRPR